jgi:hypothetical protein
MACDLEALVWKIPVLVTWAWLGLDDLAWACVVQASVTLELAK